MRSTDSSPCYFTDRSWLVLLNTCINKNKPSRMHVLCERFLFSSLLEGSQFHSYLTAQAQNAVPRSFAFFKMSNLPKLERSLLATITRGNIIMNWKYTSKLPLVWSMAKSWEVQCKGQSRFTTNEICVVYITIIPWARVGYEVIK